MTQLPAELRCSNEALREFVDSVRALAIDPCQENLEWYLAASRAIDEPRLTPPTNERSA